MNKEKNGEIEDEFERVISSIESHGLEKDAPKLVIVRWDKYPYETKEEEEVNSRRLNENNVKIVDVFYAASESIGFHLMFPKSMANVTLVLKSFENIVGSFGGMFTRFWLTRNETLFKNAMKENDISKYAIFATTDASKIIKEKVDEMVKKFTDKNSKFKFHIEMITDKGIKEVGDSQKSHITIDDDKNEDKDKDKDKDKEIETENGTGTETEDENDHAARMGIVRNGLKYTMDTEETQLEEFMQTQVESDHFHYSSNDHEMDSTENMGFPEFVIHSEELEDSIEKKDTKFKNMLKSPMCGFFVELSESQDITLKFGIPGINELVTIKLYSADAKEHENFKRQLQSRFKRAIEKGLRSERVDGSTRGVAVTSSAKEQFHAMWPDLITLPVTIFDSLESIVDIFHESGGQGSRMCMDIEWPVHKAGGISQLWITEDEHDKHTSSHVIKRLIDSFKGDCGVEMMILNDDNAKETALNYLKNRNKRSFDLVFMTIDASNLLFSNCSLDVTKNVHTGCVIICEPVADSENRSTYTFFDEITYIKCTLDDLLLSNADLISHKCEYEYIDARKKIPFHETMPLVPGFNFSLDQGTHMIKVNTRRCPLCEVPHPFQKFTEEFEPYVSATKIGHDDDDHTDAREEGRSEYRGAYYSEDDYSEEEEEEEEHENDPNESWDHQSTSSEDETGEKDFDERQPYDPVSDAHMFWQKN